MNKLTWRPADGQLLLSLREKAGIDASVFARDNTVSLAQLKELETADGHRFYSAQIKRNAGVKMLKNLGHELPRELPQENSESNDSSEPDTDANRYKTPPLKSKSTSEIKASRHKGFLKTMVILLAALTFGATVFMGSNWARQNANLPLYVKALPPSDMVTNVITNATEMVKQMAPDFKDATEPSTAPNVLTSPPSDMVTNAITNAPEMANQKAPDFKNATEPSTATKF